MFTEKNILSILEKELIGKYVRICTYDSNILQYGMKIVKKTHSVTDKQFESGNPIYCTYAKNTVRLGRHRKYEDSKIIRIWFEFNENDYGHDSKELKAELENGREIYVRD